ncbi:serine hydrolase [Microbacterium sp. MEC084]|uniref:serine hydrolase domain-containing protein n=1 Tax=Microbacterium sp. MEC084 TaxID=1963027 RepID=UPI00106F9879|nr:serine hydrolase domain-containing protein [Microbacterium sp. MEC084]MCD1267922.1 serine hydrolase [Microbacterium sp. MEC084]
MRITSRWRRAVAALAGAAAIAVAISGCTGGDPRDATTPDLVSGELPGDTVEQLQGAVEHAMAATGSSGAIVGVWVPWAGAWVTGLGSTAHEGGSEVSTDMAFRIASMTRPMTCDVLYGMVEDGIVELDDPVSKYVPSTPDLTDVTLKQLCDNTSGLARSHDTLLDNYLRTPEREWNAREVAAAGLGKDRTEAGVAFTDSDTGYLLLGVALQNAASETPAALMRRYVTGPLGLDQTRLPGARAEAPGEPALPGYYSDQEDRDAGCVAPREYTEMSASFGYTDSGAVSTIDDLGAYTASLAARAKDGDALAPRWADAKPISTKSDSWYQYAGGTFIAGSMVGQQGTVPGYMTSAYADMDNGLTVAVVLNNSAAPESLVGYLAKELAAIVSKVPAREGGTAPEFGLPWTAEDYHQRIADRAVCPIE